MGTIDADAHVVETERTWEYANGDAKQYMPVNVEVKKPDGSFEDFWLIDGRLHPRRRNIGHDTTTGTREMSDVDARLEHMDQLGVDMHVLYPSIFLRPLTDKPAAELAMHRSYNRWMADIWSHSKGRLRWAAMIPYLSPDEAIKEMRWARDNGACALFARGIEADRRMTDPYFYPIYEEACELDIPLGIHSSGSTLDMYEWWGDEAGFSRFKLTVVGCFHNMVMGNLSGKFPRLRAGFIEVSSQWIPYVIHDLRKRLEVKGRTLTDNVLKENNLWVACQTDDDLPYVLKYAGEDNLIIGSDYGHNDTSTELEALKHLKESGEVEERVVNKILDDNARALYGF